ncbi:MAG TPA: PAS domain S-box protein [Candidatus Solibacter sp.]|nr:PAS domain S-box protein [Candidatus Solibacter sp.]
MPKHDEFSPSSPKDSPSSAVSRSTISSRLEQFEKRQSELWRLTFVLLLILSIVFAFTSWGTIRSLAHRFEALPIGLVVLVALFGFYAWKRTQEISELRGLVRGLEQHDAAPPSDRQMDQLFAVISRSQQGYRDLIDSFDDILVALSLEGEIRAVNRSFADLVGATYQQIIGRPLTEFLEEGGGEGAELIRRALPRFLERRHWSGIIQVRLKKQNSICYFDCVAHAMTRDNAVHGLTILGRDITALRKNEARFTELFESLQEGIYIVTAEGAILDANPALIRMLGFDSKEDLLSKKVQEVATDRAERKALIEEVERQPAPHGREITLQRKDGSLVVCLNTTTAVRDTSGRVIRYQGSVLDVTARRQMERQLHKEQEFARRLIDSFPDLILVVDTNSRFTFVSPRCKEVLGYELSETEEMEFGGRTHSEDRPILLALFNDVLAGRQNYGSLEVRVRHKLGDWRRIRFNFSPLADETGKIEGVVLSGRDVTELKRLEEQLIQAEKLAAMGQMLAGVAHELNNPLTAILGVTELLREGQSDQEATKRQLELTHRQARRAARIVQNLLEFSRPASPQKKPIDLNGIVERTLQLHEHSLRRNNVEVDFRPQPELPGVIGDANQLIQVFLNLVTNAEQAIREVRESGRIQIRFTRLGSRVSVTFQDDGVGIRPDSVPRLFDPFYTTKRPGGGTGLGLSICLSIIREHGGTIEAEALPAGGSAFTVYLPLALGETPPSSSAAPDTSPTPSSVGLNLLKGRSILVLDDEESVRSLLREGLVARELAVDSAATAKEALAFVAHRSYDAILCDLNLAEAGTRVSGKQAAEQILVAHGSRKPVVIYMSGDLIESSEGPGGPHHLQKPFRVSEVLALLLEVLADALPPTPPQ